MKQVSIKSRPRSFLPHAGDYLYPERLTQAFTQQKELEERDDPSPRFHKFINLLAVVENEGLCAASTQLFCRSGLTSDLQRGQTLLAD